MYSPASESYSQRVTLRRREEETQAAVVLLHKVRLAIASTVRCSMMRWPSSVGSSSSFTGALVRCDFVEGVKKEEDGGTESAE